MNEKLARTETVIDGTTAVRISKARPTDGTQRDLPRERFIFNPSTTHDVIVRAESATETVPTITDYEDASFVVGPLLCEPVPFGSGLDLFAINYHPSIIASTTVIVEDFQ